MAELDLEESFVVEFDVAFVSLSLNPVFILVELLSELPQAHK